MSQGIVRVTPRPGAMGQLMVTVADSNPFGVRAKSLLGFPTTAFTVNDGDVVDLTIDSATMATVTKVVVPAPPSTSTSVPADI